MMGDLLKGTPIMACVAVAVNELNETIDRVAEELAGEQKANGKSQQAESPTVLEAIEQARYAMTEGIDTRVHYVIDSWLDYIEKAARKGLPICPDCQASMVANWVFIGSEFRRVWLCKCTGEKKRTWRQDDTASDAALQEGYYSVS